MTESQIQQLADAIEAAIAAEGMQTKQWEGGGEIRVYVTQQLARRRRDDMGYVAIDDETGKVTNSMRKRRAYFRDLIEPVVAAHAPAGRPEPSRQHVVARTIRPAAPPIDWQGDPQI